MLPEMIEPRIWAALAVVFCAGIMRGFTGFGAAMMIMPVLSTLFPPAEAVAIMMSLTLAATAQMMPKAFGTTNWREVFPITIAALLAVPLGGLVLISLEPDIMRRAISIGVLFFGTVLATGWRWSGKPTTTGAVIAGGLSGAINGASGAGGGPVILYLLAGPNQAETNRANLISYYAILNAFTAINLAFHGVFTWQVVGRAGILAIPFMTAIWLGSHLFFRASEGAYRKIALAALVGAGFYGLLAP